jgi:AcrR family transcriptional regulator
MMQPARRVLRVDAERNRRRLLDAATRMFCEYGVEIGVAEIAHEAGVGRGTLFRNFPTKEHLIAAIVAERVHELVATGRAAQQAEDPGEALFGFIEDAVARSHSDRALFDGLDDTWLANAEIRSAHAELLEVLDALLGRAQQTGFARVDVSAVDVLMMVKGMCEAMRRFAHVSDDLALRQIDLIRAALGNHGTDEPLRGRPPTIADLEHVRAAQTPNRSSSAPESTASAPSGVH